MVDDPLDIFDPKHIYPKEKETTPSPVFKTGKGASVSFEEGLIRDLVNAQTYIKQNGLEEDFNKFTEKYTKKKL